MGIDKKVVGVIFEAIFKRDGTMELPLWRNIYRDSEHRLDTSKFNGKWKTSGNTIRFTLYEFGDESYPYILYEGNILGDHMEGKRIEPLGTFLLWEAERKE